MKAKALRFRKAISAALFVLLLNVVGMTKGYAYDFVVNGIYYNITSSTAPRTVEVTYSNNAWYYGNHYSGEVTIPSSVSRNGITYSVTSIGAHAFINSADLTSITISNKVSSIGYNAFYGCSGLEQITVASSNTYYDSRENCNAVIISSTNELIIGCKNTNIPNSVTSIGDGAFYGCSTLTSIAIPNSVISIGEEAFYGCTGLTGTLVIPNSVISIGMGAFGGDGEGGAACAALSGLYLGSSVQTIGAFAFNGCTGLTGCLILPNSIETLGMLAFGYCSGITSIECYAVNPPTLDYHTFYQINHDIPVYVPCESFESYQTSGGWSEFTNYSGVGTDCGNFIITASANPIEGGTITGAGIYEEGDTCTLIATANVGFSFVNWTEDDEVISTVPSYTFQVTEDRNIVANFFLVLGPGMLPGMFSVSDSTQVRFSQGNLQYIGSASTPYWKFADQQWELANGNESSSWSANRDLFGWGTSGWNNGNTYYQPYNTSWFNEDNGHYLGNLYGPSGQYDLIDEYANSDWGIYNSISNGGNQPNRWRTLSIDEWDYVFNQRNTSSGIRYAKAVVSGKKGVILLPDYWNSSTYSLNNVNRQNADYGSNNITASQWNTLEASGAVFLPTTGYRIGTTVDDQLDYGYYWSSSCSSIEGAGAFLFSPYESVWGICSRPRYGGLAVRLVSNWNATSCSIEVGMNPDEGGSVTGMGTFAYGDTCTLTAIPNEGYSFINWTLNGEIVSSSPQYSFVVTHYGYYVAHFSKNYPDGAINAPFSVDPSGKHVFFSKGNFQNCYQYPQTYWKFADHQWEYFGTTIGGNGLDLQYNGNFDNGSHYSCDLYAWGTGGLPGMIWNNVELHPYNTFTDWGINPIINGGNMPDIWFTLSGNEWNYLINIRSTNSGIRYAKAQVNSVNGVILLPDNWDVSIYNLNNTNQASASFESNVISAAQWEILESNGAVFLPAAGRRYNPSGYTNVYVHDVGTTGYYWSEDHGHGLIGGEDHRPALCFNDDDLSTQSFAPCNGFSVRLVHLVHLIEVDINSTGSGTIIGSGWYGDGATCNLHASPNDGYYFVNWTKNGSVVSLDADYSFVVTEDVELVANFSDQPPTQLQAPIGAIDGLFTINSGGKQVYFSQGNLQYNAFANDWHFAENQYDVIGNDNGNISSTYNGDIDLFGWGTSGYDHGAVCYQPWSTSTTNSDYYAYSNSQYSLNDQSGQADWGYNAITNGGNTINTWRTLTKDEWAFVFNTRTTNTGIRYAKATVNGVKGVILLPDDWIADYYELSNTNTEGANFNSNLITASQWSTLEEHGAVFLPVAGYRSGTSVSVVSSMGEYWSATQSYSAQACHVIFYDNAFRTDLTSWRYSGQSVRLVCPIFEISATPNPIEGGIVSGGGAYAKGAECTLTATANEGFVFANWTQNGVIVSTDTCYSIIVTGSRALVANFVVVPNSYVITANANPSAGGTVDGGGSYTGGDTCTLTATTNEGYAFVNWTENGNEVSTSANYSFMVMGNRNLVANFSLNTYTIGAAANPTVGGTVSGMDTFNYGEIATLTATANEGYTFASWTENGTVVSTETNYSFTVIEDRNLEANFETYNYSYQYFTLESLADSNTIKLRIPSAINSDLLSSVSYSTNGISWITLAIDTTNQFISVILDAGEKVYFKGIGVQYSMSGYNSTISATDNFIAYGNIMSMLYGDSFVTQTEFPTESSYTFNRMFANNRKLVSAENLVLPATTLVSYCYTSMFSYCTSLIIAPDLPATTLANYCYSGMFRGCTSLSNAPDLPATTLASGCCSYMFSYCTSLTNVPDLPATTLASSCYANMFQDCVSLNSAPELPATTLATWCYLEMFRGCTSLTSAPELPATTLATQCYGQMFCGCTSLTSTPDLPATTLTGFCYSGMFNGCTSLTCTPDLPATTLAGSCYANMFQDCVSLNSAPELPATTLATWCYLEMFRGCTSLTSAPELPATTLATQCYGQMFCGCTSLTSTPDLPATTLTGFCYSGMFNGCSSLNEVICQAIDISAADCTTNWLQGVAETGTFHKNPEMNDWPLNSASGIPAGWNIDVFSVDITATTNPNEGGTITGAGNYNYGQTCTLNATANEGYTFTSWTKDGEIVSTESVYSFTVTESATFVANFEEIQVIYYNISANSNPSTGGSITGTGTYISGQTCTLTANANEGYSFGSWTENGETISTEAIYSFTVDGDKTLVANFAAAGNYWTPENTSNYSLTMALTGIVQIDGIEQYSDQLEVGAFCGDECRGSQMASEFFLTNRYLVMLSIAGEIGDVLTFKLYDHGLAQELNLTSPAPVTFNADGYGTPIEPYALNFISAFEINATVDPEGAGTITGTGSYNGGATCTLVAEANAGFQFENWTLDGTVVSINASYEFTVTQNAVYVAHFQSVHEQALSSGWNWYSTYIEQSGINGLTMLENSLGSNGIRIQSKSNGYVDQFEYNGTSYWYGTLNAITNEQMYMVRTNTACDATMSGQMNPFASHPITINNGWNWIGFPGNESTSVSTAMSGFTPEANDQIKSKNNGYSTYIVYGNNALWYGTLNTLEPGQGYMYKSNSGEIKTLVYQNGRGETLSDNVTTEGNTFPPEEANYAYNMTITAVVELDGDELRSEDYELAAFVGNECRGSVKLMYVEPLDRYMAFLLVSGETEESLRFVLTDGRNARWSEDHLMYGNDETVGTPTAPAILHFGSLGMNENGQENVQVYPNPSKDVFNIKGGGIRKVEIINAYGQVICTKEVKDDFVQIDLGNRAVGVYLLRVVTDKGITTQQIIKNN